MHYLYILTNITFPTLVKIGWTSTHPDIRAQSLATTGVPAPFDVAYHVEVQDGQRAERLVHDRLAAHRPRSNREFFEVPIEAAIAAVNEAAEQVGRGRSMVAPLKIERPIPVAPGIDPAVVKRLREPGLFREAAREPEFTCAMREVMEEYARLGRCLTYRDIRSRALPNRGVLSELRGSGDRVSYLWGHFTGQIAAWTYEQAGFFLSAILLKTDGTPGPGFGNLAKLVGLLPSRASARDVDALCIEHMKKAFEY